MNIDLDYKTALLQKLKKMKSQLAVSEVASPASATPSHKKTTAKIGQDQPIDISRSALDGHSVAQAQQRDVDPLKFLEFEIAKNKPKPERSGWSASRASNLFSRQSTADSDAPSRRSSVQEDDNHDVQTQLHELQVDHIRLAQRFKRVSEDLNAANNEIISLQKRLKAQELSNQRLKQIQLIGSDVQGSVNAGDCPAAVSPVMQSESVRTLEAKLAEKEEEIQKLIDQAKRSEAEDAKLKAENRQLRIEMAAMRQKIAGILRE